MKKLADLDYEICQMIADGHPPSYIAQALKIPLSWVSESQNAMKQDPSWGTDNATVGYDD